MKTSEIQDYLNFKTKIFEIAFGKDAINLDIADIKVIEKMQENAKKYSIGEVFHATSIARKLMSESQFDSDDFDDSEFEGMVSEILEYHWDFKTKEQRIHIVTTESSCVYEKIKRLSKIKGMQSENEIIENIVSNSLHNQSLIDELESYLIPETHDAELMGDES